MLGLERAGRCVEKRKRREGNTGMETGVRQIKAEGRRREEEENPASEGSRGDVGGE